jgi:hypothetical protein
VRALIGASSHQPAVISIVGAFSVLAVGVVSGHGGSVLAPLLAVVTVLTVGHRSILRWDRLIALILIVVLFVPIGRYRLPASLPFELELYRVVVAIVLLLWVSSLLIDSTVRLHGTAFDRPLLLLMACVVASEVTNPGRVATYESYVVKSLTFFFSFVLVYYLTATTLQRRSSIDSLLKLLTLGGAMIGVLAVYEQRTQYNLFDHLHTVLPFLTYQGELTYQRLGGNLRSFGPSQQPIALGAAMITILPVAIYLARTSGRRWWFAATALLIGALASGSRSAILMLGVAGLVFLFLKPNETKRLWPALVPAVVVIHFALPGTMGSLKDAFFPKGGLIAQQTRFGSDYDPLLAGGRIRVIEPTLAEASQKPFFGVGVGTRISGFNTPERNAPILDNQWLNNVLEVGFLGLAAWVWLFASAARRLMHASRRTDQAGDDWLFAALAASVTSFAIGMLTFDAFAFTQVTFIFWITLGISAALLRMSESSSTSSAPTSVHGHIRRL